MGNPATKQASPRPPDIDVYNPDNYVQGVPHDQFTWLRHNAPVYFHPEPDGRGFWAVTKFEDILQISKDPETFSSADGTNIKDYAEQDMQHIRLMMINMDPPKHAKYRKLIRKGFTPRVVERMRDSIYAHAKAAIDRVAPLGACEFVHDIAAELPLLVIADLMGVPYEDREQIFEWTNMLMGFDDPEFTDCSMEDARAAAAQVWMYAHNLAQKRRQADDDSNDLVSQLVRAEVDGQKLTDLEFNMFFLMVALAGNETTRTAIAGGMLALLEHPDQLQRLVDEPELIPHAMDELVRWVTPVQHFRRTATKDVFLGGQHVRKGDKVVMFYNSANRDEEAFDRPFELDVARWPNDHLGFGHGEHFCLGAHLARLELTALFSELLPRLGDIELDGPVERLRSNFINGIKRMPVRFTDRS